VLLLVIRRAREYRRRRRLRRVVAVVVEISQTFDPHGTNTALNKVLTRIVLERM
jgi:hypothetical protein